MAGRNDSIGQHLAADLGCTQCIWWGSAPHVLRISTFNAAARWDGVDARVTYLARYGYINEPLKFAGDDPSQVGLDRSLLTAGTTVGEISGGGSALFLVLQQLARRADNPFNLRNNGSYVVTMQDSQDVRVVKDPTQNVAVWMTAFAALLHDEVRNQPDPPANVVPGIMPTTPALPITLRTPATRDPAAIPIVPPATPRTDPMLAQRLTAVAALATANPSTAAQGEAWLRAATAKVLDGAPLAEVAATALGSTTKL